MSKMIEYMGTYEIEPDAVIDLECPPVNSPEITTHRHVVVIWEGGEVWLDMSSYGGENAHHCIDIRQMNKAGELKGQGAFSIIGGQRVVMNPTVVTGASWPGGYVMSVLTDPDGQERHARKPGSGIG